MTRPEFIASDVHLGAVPSDTEHEFIAFLRHVGTHGRSLLLLGDLFDFWFEYGTVIPGKHYRVLAALAELVSAGIPITYIGGNHDAWGGRFLRDEVGVDFRVGPIRTAIAGRPALLAHGDGLGRGDIGYRILKRVIRSRATVAAFRVLHPEIGIRVAQAVSRTKTKRDDEGASRGRAAFLERWARTQLTLDPALGWVVCGHAHHPSIEELEQGRFYLNAGDWVRHDTYITVDSTGRPALHRWRRQAARP